MPSDFARFNRFTPLCFEFLAFGLSRVDHRVHTHINTSVSVRRRARCPRKDRSLELSRTFLASDLPEFGGLFVTSDPLTMDTWPRHYENLHAIDDCTTWKRRAEIMVYSFLEGVSEIFQKWIKYACIEGDIDDNWKLGL